MVSFSKTDLMLGREGTMRAPMMTLGEETLGAEMREVVRSTIEEVINGIPGSQADERRESGPSRKSAVRRLDSQR